MSLRNLPPDFLLHSLGDRLREITDDDLSREAAPPPPIDFAPLAAAARSIGDWLLDTARARANDPDDLVAIDRIERARRATVAGAPPCAFGKVNEEDILVVLGILIEAFEIDFGVSGLGALAGSLYDATDGPAGRLVDRIVAKVGRLVPSPTCGIAPSDPPPRRPVPLPIVVRRRPRVAHGLDDFGDTTLGSILIVG